MNARSSSHRVGCIIASLAVTATAVCQTTSKPATATSPAAAVASAEGRAEIDPVVEKILDRLENREVRDLRAQVSWQLSYPIEDETQTKRGEIWYRHDEPTAKFKVHFREKLDADRKDALDEQHLFDGRWYVELNSMTRTVTRHELRGEDDRSDPYKIGEGPFPLPFGQKKADILRELDVARAAEAKDDPPGTDHLKLTPKQGGKLSEQFTVLDFWITQDGRLSGLPVKVRVGKKDGTGALNSYITVTFSDVELNTGLSAAPFKIDTPPGFQETIEKREDSTSLEMRPEDVPARAGPD